MLLESYLKEKTRQKEILLMTHVVLGYPSVDECYRVIEAMVEAGVDLMELQIPFSDPIADGPVILKANHEALGQGSTVEDCLAFAEDVASRFDIPFFIMSYYNLVFKYGVRRFISVMAGSGLSGAIVPDLPPEEGAEYFAAMKHADLYPVVTFSPTTPTERMKFLATFGRGFVYCIARKGVTGQDTEFSINLSEYLGRCREGTDFPLALGFGVKGKADIDFLRGKVEIAVIGTQTIRVLESSGVESVGPFIKGLR